MFFERKRPRGGGAELKVLFAEGEIGVDFFDLLIGKKFDLAKQDERKNGVRIHLDVTETKRLLAVFGRNDGIFVNFFIEELEDVVDGGVGIFQHPAVGGVVRVWK